MKKATLVLFTIFLLMMSLVPVYADFGIPEGPEYTVVTAIHGTDYYANEEHYEQGNVDGTLPGGLTFYVWIDFFDDYYVGTTDATATPEEFDNCVYIPKNQVTSESEVVPPEEGIQTGNIIYAVTTGELDVRCGPGPGFKKLKTLPEGSNVDYEYIFETDSSWMYVHASGVEGWARDEYLKKIDKSSTNTSSNDVSAADYENDSNYVEEESSDEEATSVEPTDEEESTPAESKSTLIIGIILICIGAAAMIAILALYMLDRNTSGR